MGFRLTLGGLQGDILSLGLLLGKYPKNGYLPYQVTLSSLKRNLMVELCISFPVSLSTEAGLGVYEAKTDMGWYPESLGKVLQQKGHFRGFSDLSSLFKGLSVPQYFLDSLWSPGT